MISISVSKNDWKNRYSVPSRAENDTIPAPMALRRSSGIGWRPTVGRQSCVGSEAMSEKKPSGKPEPDLEGWDRFEKAVDAALHSPPQHRKPKGKLESSPAPKSGE
jgi:hypothetical protein